MKRILVATDRTEGSKHALGRACRMARSTGAELRIVSAMPKDSSRDDCANARRKIHEQAEEFPGSPKGIELDFSIRLPTGDPAEEILQAADRFRPDIIILGAHGEPRLRDVISGTTASHVVRESKAPVLVVQNDDSLPYCKVMAAVDDEAAEDVLDVAFGIATAEDLFVVHAFAGTKVGVFGDDELLEDVRTRNDVLILTMRQKARHARSANPSVHVHNVVEQGEVMEVIMRAWTGLRPDLLVIGTHGRAGLARVLRGSYAESALLGCPSDILVVRTALSVGDRG